MRKIFRLLTYSAAKRRIVSQIILQIRVGFLCFLLYNIQKFKNGIRIVYRGGGNHRRNLFVHGNHLVDGFHILERIGIKCAFFIGLVIVNKCLSGFFRKT
jgi:hypothetical protein